MDDISNIIDCLNRSLLSCLQKFSAFFSAAAATVKVDCLLSFTALVDLKCFSTFRQHCLLLNCASNHSIDVYEYTNGAKLAFPHITLSIFDDISVVATLQMQVILQCFFKSEKYSILASC